ncbi:MAG TPA: hypothetical protein VGI92_10355 [Gemmatimonadales bacterium]|jgi:hypothetical protein
MRLRTITALACGLAATACSDRPTQPIEAPAQFQPVAAPPCVPRATVEKFVNQLLPGAADRSMVLSRYGQIVTIMGREQPDTMAAHGQAVSLAAFLIGKYRAGALTGGQGSETQIKLVQVLNGILCAAGLPQVFTIGSLGSDGAAAFIYPVTPDTIVVTQTLLSGVEVPTGSVGQPSIVTITRLPDFPGPLLTPLDQYPIYYEVTVTPVQVLASDVVVGVCLAGNVTPPDLSRLRVAHNIAPFTPGSIGILPLAPAPFIDCTNAPFAAAPSTGHFDLATRLQRRLSNLLLPEALAAGPLFAAGGVGGTTRNFSPFGSVDTLGTMTAATRIEFHGSPNGPADGLPSVVISTPTGRPMPGISVTFAITSGSGSISGASTVTDANGVATLGGWTLGPVVGCTVVTTTASMTAGSGLTGNGTRFGGCVR